MKKIEKSKIIKKTFKIIGLVISLFILMNVLLAAYIYWNEDSFKARLIDLANTYQKGRISTEKISLSPFKHFPQVSIELQDVSYFESDSLQKSFPMQPICQFDHVYIAINFLQLLKGNIRISEATLEDGIINLALYADSSLNILNAIASPKEEIRIKGAGILDNDVKVDVYLQQINFTNIGVQFTNDLANKKSALHLNYLNTYLSYTQDSLHCRLISDLKIGAIQKESRKLFQDLNVECDLDFSIDIKQEVFHLNPSRLAVQGANFKINGRYEMNKNGRYNFDVRGSDYDMSFYRLIMDEEIIENNLGNLEKGDIYFDGKIEGRTIDEFIFAEFSFGVENIRIDIASDVDPIDQLRFKGFFTTGKKADYSQGKLILNNLKARLPDGYLSANINLTNFYKPKLSFKIDGKIDLEKIGRAFKLDKYIDNMKGAIFINSDYEGYFDLKTDRMTRRKEKSIIRLESVAFRLPGSDYNVDFLDGEVAYNKGKYHLRNLKFVRGLSDITVNGEVSNLTYLLLKKDAEIEAKLKIDSERLIIKELIGKDEDRSKILNDTLSNIHLNVGISSATSSLLNINAFPASIIKIYELSARLQTTPDVYKGNGVLIFEDNPDWFRIVFDGVDLQTNCGGVNITGNLLISDTLDQKIEFSTILKKIDVIKTKNELKLVELEYAFLDSLDGKLKSDFDLFFKFSADSFEMRRFSIENMNFDFSNKITVKKIILKKINFVIKDFIYENLDGKISAYQGEANFGKIDIEAFKINDIKFTFKRNQDVYQMFPDLTNFIGEGSVAETATIWIDISDSIPAYRANFKINDVLFANVMKNNDKKILDGKINFNFLLSSSGTGIDELLMNLNGEATTVGDNLLLYGVDIDDILNKIQRFQSFNLVDVSAYFIAGPLAPLATKGYDAANMITMTSGEKTKVTKFISNWTIENGLATIKDAALATEKNRIAIKGGIDIIKGEMVNVTVAVLNKRGCSLISQVISGPFSDPKLGDLKAVGPIRGTLQSLIRTITGEKCKPFYTGSVAHPN